MSDRVIYAMLVFYVLVALASAREKDWWRVLYFVGAILISISVLGMTTRRTHG